MITLFSSNTSYDRSFDSLDRKIIYVHRDRKYFFRLKNNENFQILLPFNLIYRENRLEARRAYASLIVLILAGQNFLAALSESKDIGKNLYIGGKVSP